LHARAILVAVTNLLEVALVRLSPCPAALLAAVVLLSGCGGDDPRTRVAYTVQAADPDVTGGPAAGDGHGAISRYDAVLRAARAPAHAATHGAPAYWRVDDKRRRALRVATRARAQVLRTTRPAGTRIVVVPAGRLIVRAQATAADRWYVLDDDPAATGTDIDGARPGRDQLAGTPVVLMTFTAHGRTAFSALTARLAHRGAHTARAGARGPDANQHFAIVLDDRVLATPYVDYQESPDRIDAAVGSQISGGLTTQEAARVAGLISSGPLPARLVAHGMKAEP
jgi:hypothetical protein